MTFKELTGMMDRLIEEDRKDLVGFPADRVDRPHEGPRGHRHCGQVPEFLQQQRIKVSTFEDMHTRLAGCLAPALTAVSQPCRC